MAAYLLTGPRTTAIVNKRWRPGTSIPISPFVPTKASQSQYWRWWWWIYIYIYSRIILHQSFRQFTNNAIAFGHQKIETTANNASEFASHPTSTNTQGGENSWQPSSKKLGRKIQTPLPLPPVISPSSISSSDESLPEHGKSHDLK